MQPPQDVVHSLIPSSHRYRPPARFAAFQRTNVRTLENWEQVRAKPSAPAALLISLVRRFPDTVERLAVI